MILNNRNTDNSNNFQYDNWENYNQNYANENFYENYNYEPTYYATNKTHEQMNMKQRTTVPLVAH